MEIKHASMNLGMFLLGGAIVAAYISASDRGFEQHVEKAIFDECFTYFADTSRGDGLAITSVAGCVAKAKKWSAHLPVELRKYE